MAPQIDIPNGDDDDNEEQLITATRTGNGDDDDDYDQEQTRTTEQESTSESTSTSSESESTSTATSSSSSSTSSSDSESSSSTSSSESESSSETESLITSSSTSSSSTDASSSLVTESKSTAEPTLTDSLIQQDSSDLASATSSAEAKSEDSDSTSLGTIVGIVAVAATALVVLSAFVLWKRKQRAHRKLKTEQSAAAFGGSSSDDDLTEVKAIPRGLEEEHWNAPPVPPRSAAPFLARPESPYSASPGFGGVGGGGGMGYAAPYAGSTYTLGEVRSPSPLVMPPPRDFASPAPSYNHPSHTPSMDLYGGMYPQQPTVDPRFAAASPSPFQPYAAQWDHGQQFQEPEQPSMAYMPNNTASRGGGGGGGECLSPQNAEGPQDPSTRASKCTSGFSYTSADNRISTSAFPVPPPSSKDEEEVPALPPLTEIDSQAGTARGSVSDPIPRSLTPGHNTLDRHSQAFRQSFMARPVSHLSSAASFETATESDHKNNKDRFFLPPLQIPSHQNGTPGETEESESLDQATSMEPPKRPFVASPLEMEGSLQEALPGSNRSSASTVKRGDDPADSPGTGGAGTGSPFATKPKEGSTLAHVAQASISSTSSATIRSPFESSEDEHPHQELQRESFDVLGHYGSSYTPDAGASEVLDGGKTTPIHRQDQQSPPGHAGQQELYTPGRVSNSDWGFLDDLLEGDRDPKATGGRPL